MTRRLALLLTILFDAGCSPAPTSSPTSTAADSLVPSPSPTARAGLHGQIAYVAGQDPQIHLLDMATGESRQLTQLRPEHAELAAEGPNAARGPVRDFAGRPNHGQPPHHRVIGIVPVTSTSA